eukprot:SAG11_NODE_1606_length_4591_cov_1.769813_1_plen_189_part_00
MTPHGPRLWCLGNHACGTLAKSLPAPGAMVWCCNRSAMFLLQSFPAACLHAIKAMLIKQGVSVTDAGKGKLAAAIAGLGNLAGIVMPAFVWAPLFKFFVDGSAPLCLMPCHQFTLGAKACLGEAGTHPAAMKQSRIFSVVAIGQSQAERRHDRGGLGLAQAHRLGGFGGGQVATLWSPAAACSPLRWC